MRNDELMHYGVKGMKWKDHQYAADDVIKGKYGNGKARINALVKKGYDAKVVQDLVNKKIKEKKAAKQEESTKDDKKESDKTKEKDEDKKDKKDKKESEVDKKVKDEEKKPHKKNRLRDKKNKGKPDFAAKRAKKALRAKAKEQASKSE